MKKVIIMRSILLITIATISVCAFFIDDFSAGSLSEICYAIEAPTYKAVITEGQYLTFGEYLGEPILWRVIKGNENEAMLLSDKILTLKGFDAKGDNPAHLISDIVDYPNDRKLKGSNNWEMSNIRQWLNSDDENIIWSCVSPTSNNMYGGQNGYETENGFLSKSNFSDKEKNAILLKSNNVILNSIDKAQTLDGKSTALKYNINIVDVDQNYECAYYKKVLDKVTLLDVKDAKNLVYDKFGEDFYLSKPTRTAVLESEYKSDYINENNYGNYWLITPDASIDYPESVRYVNSEGYLLDSNANNERIGIRPTIHIDLSKVFFEIGDGTNINPYKLYADKYPLISIYDENDCVINSLYNKKNANLKVTVDKNNENSKLILAVNSPDGKLIHCFIGTPRIQGDEAIVTINLDLPDNKDDFYINNGYVFKMFSFQDFETLTPIFKSKYID